MCWETSCFGRLTSGLGYTTTAQLLSCFFTCLLIYCCQQADFQSVILGVVVLQACNPSIHSFTANPRPQPGLPETLSQNFTVTILGIRTHFQLCFLYLLDFVKYAFALVVYWSVTDWTASELSTPSSLRSCFQITPVTL